MADADEEEAGPLPRGLERPRREEDEASADPGGSENGRFVSASSPLGGRSTARNIVGRFGARMTEVRKSLVKGQMSSGAASLDAATRKYQHVPWSLTVDGVRAALAATEAAAVQREFVEVFIRAVVEPVLDAATDMVESDDDDGETEAPGRHLLLLSTDLRRLELQVDTGSLASEEKVDAGYASSEERAALEAGGSDSKLRQLAVELLGACGAPKEAQAEALRRLDQALEACPQKPGASSLWCRLERMGTPTASIDAGFTLDWAHTRPALEWMAADMLMPAGEDKEALLDFAMAEQPQLRPTVFSCSLMPSEPQRALLFRLPEGPGAPMSGLMFFKSLGFARPVDDALTALFRFPQRLAAVCVCFGPRGLTRVGLRLQNTSGAREEESSAQQLANALHFPYRAAELKGVFSAQQATEAGVLEYGADAQGYTVSVGFMS